MLFFYTLLFRCALPFIFLRLWWRGLREPSYRQRWWQRLGYGPERPEPLESTPRIWVHAVSFGEAKAASILIRAIFMQHPHWQWVVTTTTATGAATIERECGDIVEHRFCPFDLPGCWRRFLSRVKPSAAMVMETEIWPNQLLVCGKQKIPVYLVNARLSPRSAKGYARSLVKRALRRPLQQFTAVAAQTQEDADRLVAIGIPVDRVRCVGNIKQAQTIPALTKKRDELSNLAMGVTCDDWRLKQRFIWVAASTHPGEDEIVFAAHKKLLEDLPSALLIVAPRHLTRLKSIEKLCKSASLQFLLCSEVHKVSTEVTAPQVIIWDSLGKLMLAYAMADVACVAGSFAPIGGHNLLEPAALAKPIIVGPQTFKIPDLVGRMQQVGALVVCDNAQALAEKLLYFAEHSDARSSAGTAAFAVYESGRRVLSDYYTWMNDVMPTSLQFHPKNNL